MASQPPVAPPPPALSVNSNPANHPLPPSVFTLPQTAQLEALYTIIRDKETSRGDFLFYSDRIIRLLVEEGLNHLPVVARSVETPTVRVHFPTEPSRVVGQCVVPTYGTVCDRVLRTMVWVLKARYAVCRFCGLARCVGWIHVMLGISDMTGAGYGGGSP